MTNCSASSFQRKKQTTMLWDVLNDYQCWRRGGWPRCPSPCPRPETTGTRTETSGLAGELRAVLHPLRSQTDLWLESEPKHRKDKKKTLRKASVKLPLFPPAVEHRGLIFPCHWIRTQMLQTAAMGLENNVYGLSWNLNAMDYFTLINIFMPKKWYIKFFTGCIPASLFL